MVVGTGMEKEMSLTVIKGMSSEREWCSIGEGDNLKMKVLSYDQERHLLEVLIKAKGGNRSGEHKHTCETQIYVLEGKVKNHTIGCTFSSGDYCYQPLNDIHDEEFLEDTTVYASYRGYYNTLVELFDENKNVCGELKLENFVS